MNVFLCRTEPSARLGRPRVQRALTGARGPPRWTALLACSGAAWHSLLSMRSPPPACEGDSRCTPRHPGLTWPDCPGKNVLEGSSMVPLTALSRGPHRKSPKRALDSSPALAQQKAATGKRAPLGGEKAAFSARFTLRPPPIPRPTLAHHPHRIRSHPQGPGSTLPGRGPVVPLSPDAATLGIRTRAPPLSTPLSRLASGSRSLSSLPVGPMRAGRRPRAGPGRGNSLCRGPCAALGPPRPRRGQESEAG